MRLTIKLKLGLAFAAVIVMSAGMSVLAISSLSSLNATMEDVLHGPVQRAQWEEQLHWMLLAIVRAEKNLVLAESPQQVEAYSQELQQQRDAFNALADKLNAIASIEGRKRLDVLRAGFQLVDAYRYNSASIRVRVVDPRFTGKSVEKRDAMVEPHLAKLPESTQADIMNLFTFAPDEIASPAVSIKSYALNTEFDEPSPSGL